MSTIAGYTTQTYDIPIAGRVVHILGPDRPHALNYEAAYLERSRREGYKPTWAQPWPSAVMLAETVLAERPACATAVLEVGAGLGIATVALAVAGYRVLATDYDEHALEYIRASAALNGVALHGVRRLDWQQPPDERFDLVVGSDIAWEPRHHAAIAALIAACLSPTGRAYVSDPNRSGAERFPEALSAAGLTWRETACIARAIPARGSADGRTLRGRVLRIKWNACEPGSAASDSRLNA